MGGDFRRASAQLSQAMDREIPVSVGGMLVDGFRRSFRDQRFNDTGSRKWDEVQRRIEGSPWYGFNRGTNASVPPGSRGYHRSGRPRRYGTRGGTTNFSPAATTRNILFGSGSSALRDSIFLQNARAMRVVIASDAPHAQVHNEGLPSKIFGRKVFRMPKRQFMGTSNLLNTQARGVIDRIVTRIMR